MSSEFPKYDALIAAGAFPSDKAQADYLFQAALEESFSYHLDNCPAFANYCKNKKFSYDLLSSDLKELPFVPVQAFKVFGRDLLVTQAANEKTFFMNSSATSGRPSTINVSRQTAKRQAKSMALVISSFLSSKKRPFIIFDVKPKKSTSGDIGARYGATVGFMSFSSHAYFVLEEDSDGEISLNPRVLNQAIKKVEETGVAPVIFGFTYVIFSILNKLKNVASLVEFEAGTILHIGGWKKLEEHSISRARFNDIVSARFGLKPRDVIDVYGFTEQMGINYPSSSLDDKIAPNFVRVLVRDPDTMQVLSSGEEGLLQFISPLPLSYPGISVLTDDIGFITSSFDKLQSHHGTTFRVTGRAKNAEVRGCGDIMSAYLKRSDNNLHQDSKRLPPRFLFYEKTFVPKRAITTVLDFDTLPEIADLRQIEIKLRSNLSDLQKYSVDDLISFFSILSQSFMDERSPLKHLQSHGLSFLVSWLNADNLRAVANKSMKGKRTALDRFVPDSDFPGRLLRAVPRGIVGHWLAGNVPLLGMLGLVQSILSKNANIIRVPASNSSIMPVMLDVISKSKIELQDGTVVDGADIAKSTVVLYYDKSDKVFADDLSNICDARIAWGGAEAVSTVAALPTKLDSQTVIFGPKLSYMAISREMFENDNNTEKLFRRIAIDCSVFDQYACASPHTIFVEKNNEFSATDFCERLAHHMTQAAHRIPKDKIDAGTATQIISKRIEYELRGKTWQSEGTTWSIVYDPDSIKLADPTYSRFVKVVFVNNILEAAEQAHSDIQTISLAMPYERRIKFADIAIQKGAIRFPEIGRMTHFETPWDGIFLMDRLVRYVTLGGPMV